MKFYKQYFVFYMAQLYFTVILMNYFVSFVGLCVRWMQHLQTADLVQSSCVLESADQNSGLAPHNSTPLWYDCNSPYCSIAS